MEIEALWFHCLQQFIFKNYYDEKVVLEALLNDTLSMDFLINATNEGYLNSDDNYMNFTMTDKLKYSPFPFASFKYNPKNKANKFNPDIQNFY